MPVIENKDIKVGTIMAFPSSSIPNDWLICNGAEISRNTYKNLFDVIGTTYGAGNGTTTFNLPDLRGKFIRGLGSYDSARYSYDLGVVQKDDFKMHSHNYLRILWPHFSGLDTGGGGNCVTESTFNNPGGTETRPINLAMIFCIKY